MRIIRHEIAITDYQEVRLPADGELLSVAMSRTLPNAALDVWSLDRRFGEPRKVGLYVVGTGNPMPPPIMDRSLSMLHASFLGTVVTPSGLVWHVFEGPVL
jgi:hypothetical protein